MSTQTKVFFYSSPIANGAEDEAVRLCGISLGRLSAIRCGQRRPRIREDLAADQPDDRRLARRAPQVRARARAAPKRLFSAFTLKNRVIAIIVGIGPLQLVLKEMQQPCRTCDAALTRFREAYNP